MTGLSVSAEAESASAAVRARIPKRKKRQMSNAHDDQIWIKVTEAYSASGRKFIGQVLPVMKSSDNEYSYETGYDTRLPIGARGRLFDGIEVPDPADPAGPERIMVFPPDDGGGEHKWTQQCEDYGCTVPPVNQELEDFKEKVIEAVYRTFPHTGPGKILEPLGLTPTKKKFRVSWEYESPVKLPSDGFKLVTDVTARNFRHEEVS